MNDDRPNARPYFTLEGSEPLPLTDLRMPSCLLLDLQCGACLLWAGAWAVVALWGM